MSISMAELKRVIEEAKEVLSREPTLINRSSDSLLIVGDTHGDLQTTQRILSSEINEVVFLGDYVDRGPKQIENILTLIEHKISSPNSITLLRGNHETRSMNLYYGFYNAVNRRWGRAAYGLFSELFAQLPLAAVINGSILLLHGGIPEGAESVAEIAALERGEEDPTDPIALQILWNDPRTDISYFGPSPRGSGARTFGEGALKKFLDNSHLNVLVRSHEPVSNGYAYLFGNRLLTVFSCRYYGIRPAGALLNRGELRCVYVDDPFEK